MSDNDTPHDKIHLTYPISSEDPGGDDDNAPEGWIEIQRDDSPDAPPGETWTPLASDDEAALAVCPYTACMYHCETGAMALLSDEEACKALPAGPVICIVPRDVARRRYAEAGIAHRILITTGDKAEARQRIYILAWAPSYDEASSGGYEWRRSWVEIREMLTDPEFMTPGHDYRVITLDLPGDFDDDTIDDFLESRGAEVIDPPDPRQDLANALDDFAS